MNTFVASGVIKASNFASQPIAPTAPDDVTKKLGIENCEKITFHGWRHFFTANMADHVDERKLQLATGHKTLDILEHYASHESEKSLKELGRVAEEIFMPIMTNS